VSGIDLILAAMAAGVATGAKDTAATATADAYAALRELVRRRLAGGPRSQQVLEANTQPQGWKEQLRMDLVSAEADRDEELLMAARRLLELSNRYGTQNSKYYLEASNGRGVQIGDHNIQHNTFS
jgi:hypothetical protein